MISVIRVARLAHGRIRHSLQPDFDQSPAYLLDGKFLVTFAAKKLLYPRVINDHAQESTGCQQWVHRAKGPVCNPPTDIVGQDLIMGGRIRPEKPVRQAVILQCAVEQQPGKSLVFSSTLQDVSRNPGQDLGVRPSLGELPP